MRKHFIIAIFLVLSPCLYGKKKESPRKANPQSTLQALYHSIDPLSIVQNLAFYELYPDTTEGKGALDQAWTLLNGGVKMECICIPLPKFDITPIISLVTRQPSDPVASLSEKQLQIIERFGSRLSNRHLKGHTIWEKKDLITLENEEIDLGRALLLYQFEGEDYKQKIRQYEASLDLMALQILAYLPKQSSNEEKIKQINRFIFQEMRFRFPPHSIHIKDIDLYTFLPSVLDTRQGVCLGVSILYLCLAQRLNLPLEIITPPGHIYLRYSKENGEVINIETTARGVDLPSETYLGINTRLLKKRTMKQVIGLSFINQASVMWGKQDYQTTVKLYEQADPFMPNDELLHLLLGLNYLFVGKVKQGRDLLSKIKTSPFEDAVSIEPLIEDALIGNVDTDGLKAVFLPVDENRSSILEKQAELKKILSVFPKYRAGLLHLATTYLQLGRNSEALDILQTYHKIDPTNSTIEYYLTVLSLERYDYNQAWKHFRQAEKLTTARDHYPRVLKDLKEHLRKLCPEPLSS